MQTTIRKYSGFVILAGIMLFAARVARAQFPSDPEQYMLEIGSPAFNTPIGVPNGFVNLANGNLHIEVPIASYPQRGGVPFVTKLVYDSRIWKISSPGNVGQWTPTNTPGIQPTFQDGTPISNLGWRLVSTTNDAYASNVTSDTTYHSCVSGGITYYYTKTSNYRYRDMGNTIRKFPLYKETSNVCYTPPTSNTLSGPSLDGTGMRMTQGTAIEVRAADGTQVYSSLVGSNPKVSLDTNGNYHSRDVYGIFTDTLNHALPVSETYILPPSTLQLSYTVPTTSGSTATTLTFSSKSVTTAFIQEDVSEHTGTYNTLTTIATGNGNYTFTYDSYGVMASMTLPTGATINFTHANMTDALGNVNRFLNTVVVDSQTTTYTFSNCGSTCSKPTNCSPYCNKMVVKQPNNDESEYLFNVNQGAWLTQTKVFTGSVASGTLLQTTNIDYANNATNSALGSWAFTRPIRTTVTLPAPNSTNLVKKTELAWETFTYDYKGTNYTGTRGNVTTTQEFPFKSCSSNCPSSVSWGTSEEYRRTVNTYLHTSNSNYTDRNIINRVTNSQMQTYTGTKLTETITTYDNYTSPNQLVNVSNVTHHDTANYGTSFTYRGNPTSIAVWTGGSNYLTTTVTYDITGQVTKVTNPKGNYTTYSYTDSYLADNNTSSPSAYSPTPPTTNAFPTSSTSPLSGTVTTAYYYKTGSLAKSTDVNGNSSVTSYYQDPMMRPVKTWGPTGALTSAAYPSAIQVNITTPTATAQANFDARGRLKDTKLTNDPQGNVTTETTYDPLGRVLTKTNPYRSTTEATYGVTTYEYDGVSRVTKVTLSDNMTQWSYYGAAMSAGGGRTTQLCATGTYGLGYPTMAKDEAGKKRQSWTDAFGRLIEADEPDSTGALNLNTCYKYDERGNLKEVNQGVQTRTNTYENSGGYTIGLGRLITEVTPEGGTNTLYYTTSGGALCAANPGAVCRSTDARGITTTYSYDAEDRLVSKSYSNSDPTVTYVYDLNCLNSSGSFVSDATCSGGLQLTNPKGRRVGLTDGSGLSAWKYSQLGQVTTLRRKIGSISKDFTYAYTTDGRPDNITYPSGQVLYYQYRSDGKLLHLWRNNSPGMYYEYNLSYAPHGALTGYTQGFHSGTSNGITLANTYNNRLQPVNMKATNANNSVVLMDYTYSFTASSINDGHVKQVTNNLVSGRTQAYTYDEMNRLLTAKTSATSGAPCWGQSYVYDRYANLSAINVPSGYSGCDNGPALSLSINDTNNKITNANFSYDAAGNLTASPVGYSYTWNAEGRMATAVAGGVTYTYTYNGDGQRVKKAAASASSYDKLYWYGLGGEVLAESDLSGTLTSEYIFMGATRIARRDVSSGNVYYFLGDRLGNARIVTNSTGAVQEESDMLPYGTERAIPHTPDSGYTANNYKFTGHERDAETQQDHTLFRKYACNTGRWLSPDPVRGLTNNPQSWNRYAYSRNNPTNGRDPDGAEVIECERSDGEGGTIGSDCRGLFGRRSPSFLSNLGQCLEEPGSFGCPGSGSDWYDDPANQFLVAAINTAINALKDNESCRGIFQGGPDPVSELAGIMPTPYRIGQIGFREMSEVGRIAGTNVNTGVITINTNPALTTPGPGHREDAWMNGDPVRNAATLLHELGHRYNILYGAGSSMIVNDGIANDGTPYVDRLGQDYNRGLITERCLPTLPAAGPPSVP